MEYSLTPPRQAGAPLSLVNEGEGLPSKVGNAAEGLDAADPRGLLTAD